MIGGDFRTWFDVCAVINNRYIKARINADQVLLAGEMDID